MAPISLSTYLRHYNGYDYWVTARGTILKEEWFLLLLSWKWQKKIYGSFENTE